MRNRNNLAFLAVFAMVIAFAVACATLPQIKPTSPEFFIGEYIGTWHSSSGPWSGGVNLTVGKPRDGVIDLWVTLTHSRFGNWQTVAKFVDGELVVDREALWMILRLYGGDRLGAEYHNKMTGDRGTWALAKKSN